MSRGYVDRYWIATKETVEVVMVVWQKANIQSLAIIVATRREWKNLKTFESRVS